MREVEYSNVRCLITEQRQIKGFYALLPPFLSAATKFLITDVHNDYSARTSPSGLRKMHIFRTETVAAEAGKDAERTKLPRKANVLRILIFSTRRRFWVCHKSTRKNSFEFSLRDLGKLNLNFSRRTDDLSNAPTTRVTFGLFSAHTSKSRHQKSPVS